MNIEEIKVQYKIAESEFLTLKAKEQLDSIVSSWLNIPALLAEVERLTAENATLTDTARQNYCKFVRQQEGNATLKKELAELKENQLDPLEMAKVAIALKENATLKEDKEFCLSTAKCNAEFYDDAKKEIAILRKAVEMIRCDLNNVSDFPVESAEWYIKQAQQTHETQEAEK